MKLRDVLILSVSFPFFALAQEASYEFEGIKNIDIDNSSGTVIFRGTETSDKAKVKVKKQRVQEGCDLVVTSANGNLEIQQKAPEKVKMGCENEIEVQVPNKEDLNLVVQNKNGDIRVSDFAGDLDVDLEKGRLVLSNATINNSKVAIETGSLSGDKAVFHEGFVTVKDGDVSISYHKIPNTGKLDITALRGNIELAIPSDMKADTVVAAPSGPVTSDVVPREGGPTSNHYSFTLIVPRGNISIKKN